MSAASKAKCPPTFLASEIVDIEVDPEDLEAAGWVYVGKGSKDAPAVTTQHAVDVVRRWHDATHPGPWRWCTEEPCRDLKDADA